LGTILRSPICKEDCLQATDFNLQCQRLRGLDLLAKINMDYIIEEDRQQRGLHKGIFMSINPSRDFAEFLGENPG
jgi:hypothetical protein